jgi:hypothetical protein
MDVHKDPHQARDRKEIRRGKKRGRSEEERPKRRRKAGAKKRDRSEEERQQRRRKTETKKKYTGRGAPSGRLKAAAGVRRQNSEDR